MGELHPEHVHRAAALDEDVVHTAVANAGQAWIKGEPRPAARLGVQRVVTDVYGRVSVELRLQTISAIQRCCRANYRPVSLMR